MFGDTPSPAAIRSLVEHLLFQREEFSISKYELSVSKDIRPLVIATAIAYMELDGIIVSQGPFYSSFKFQYLQPEEKIPGGTLGRTKGVFTASFCEREKGQGLESSRS